jgi:hypothetical protein
MYRSNPAELIQAGGKLTNSIWNKEELPQHWKKSIAINIYKTMATELPVLIIQEFLLPATHKILSNILFSTLTPHVDEIIGVHHCYH